MRSAIRSTVSVVCGFVIASIVMMLVESLNGQILYPELAKAADGVTDRETLRDLIAAAPAGALLVVLFAWVLGGVAGGWITARLAALAAPTHSLVLGALLTLAGVANNLMVPPPPWFWVASLAVLAPAAWAGARLAPAH